MAQESLQWLLPGGVSPGFSQPGGRRTDGEATLRQARFINLEEDRKYGD